jgi:hypothetical protein
MSGATSRAEAAEEDAGFGVRIFDNSHTPADRLPQPSQERPNQGTHRLLSRSSRSIGPLNLVEMRFTMSVGREHRWETGALAARCGTGAMPEARGGNGF